MRESWLLVLGFAGQALFLEWRSDEVFGGFFIPEQDLEFLKDASDPRG